MVRTPDSQSGNGEFKSLKGYIMTERQLTFPFYKDGKLHYGSEFIFKDIELIVEKTDKMTDINYGRENAFIIKYKKDGSVFETSYQYSLTIMLGEGYISPLNLKTYWNIPYEEISVIA